jgi:rare lipoprotein A
MSLRPKIAIGVALGAICLGTACAGSPRGGRHVEEGLASWYHDSLAGRATASGEPYDPRAATCAHKTEPFGTRLEVTVVDTGAKVVCRVNDRGPFVEGRIIDVSRSLARELGIEERGIAPVRVRRLD